MANGADRFSAVGQPPSSSVRPGGRALSIVLGAVILALGACVVWARAETRRARDTAARLTGCPADALDVEMASLGDATRWRIDGCGTRGTLVCAPENPGCFVEPDGHSATAR